LTRMRTYTYHVGKPRSLSKATIHVTAVVVKNCQTFEIYIQLIHHVSRFNERQTELEQRQTKQNLQI